MYAPRATNRIAGRALQRIRTANFDKNPLCVRCWAQGRTRVWTQLDHVIPLEKGGVDSHDPFVNRQGLCDECHVEKTAEDRGYKAIGCDVDGMPTDKRHPWNKAKRKP